jgi:hypothetical protein
VAEFLEPEIGDSRQYFALARNRVGQDDVEGREAIGRNDQQLVGVDRVDVANFALGEQWQAGNGRLEERSGHGRFPESKRWIIN